MATALSTSVLSLPNLGPGSTDAASVKKLQDALVAAGYMTQAQVQTGYGIYGPQTTAAVAAWQAANGINTSGNPGYFGPASKTFIQSTSTSSQQAPAPTSSPTPTSTYQAPAPSPQPTAPSATGSLDPSILNTVTSNLGPGSTGSQVTALQQALVQAGYMTQAQMNTGPGTYGPQTTAAVSAWQAANGINTNGNPGYFGPISKLFIQGSGSQQSISPTLPKSDYSQTPAGQIAGADTGHTLNNDVLPSSMQNLAVYNLPSEAFSALVPQLVPGTPQYQAAMDKLSTAYFDVMQQQMNASTEQEQQAAQYNWNSLKKTIETNLNITLSNDALQAWDQIEGLRGQYGQQGIEGSGLQTEAVDDYLKKVRLQDSSSRTDAQTKEEAAQQEYYMKFATPQQIKDFALANPTLAKSWGLLPSDAIKAAMTPAALKAKYPNMSDAEIQQNIASILDENGNYRSGLYQKYMTGSNLGANLGNVDTANIVYDQYGNPIAKPVRPSDTGVLDINAAKTQYQQLNTPLASQSADYAARVKLGSIPPTSGAASGTAAGTQFNQIQPSTTSTPSSSSPTPTLANPITVPQSMTTSAPAPTPTTTTTTTTAPKTSYGSLYDYYTATSGSMPAWNSPTRLASAQAAGITNYTGTADQNAKLLAYLQK